MKRSIAQPVQSLRNTIAHERVECAQVIESIHDELLELSTAFDILTVNPFVRKSIFMDLDRSRKKI